jgi:restriction system protein
VKTVPGRGILLLSVVSYAGFGLALPLLLDWPKIWVVVLNLWGTVFAGSLLFGWLFVRLQSRDRRHLLEWTSDLRRLDGQEFEWLVGELFRREGWAVVERGRQDAGDGNIDLELTRGPDRRLVQCKRWTAKWVGVDEIRSFTGTLSAENLAPSAGIFVTLRGYTQQSRDLAAKSGLELVEGPALFDRVEKVRNSEACKDCHQPMLLDHSAHGWWFRCTTTGCGGKRHLDKDPGRAVALLTEPR